MEILIIEQFVVLSLELHVSLRRQKNRKKFHLSCRWSAIFMTNALGVCDSIEWEGWNRTDTFVISTRPTSPHGSKKAVRAPRDAGQMANNNWNDIFQHFVLPQRARPPSEKLFWLRWNLLGNLWVHHSPPSNKSWAPDNPRERKRSELEVYIVEKWNACRKKILRPQIVAFSIIKFRRTFLLPPLDAASCCWGGGSETRRKEWKMYRSKSLHFSNWHTWAHRQHASCTT